jgi:hypothetical protein
MGGQGRLPLLVRADRALRREGYRPVCSYDPGSPDGRLLLGLKGTISEVELHTIRARLTAGLLNKAGRGDLALHLPVGLIHDAAGVAAQDPNREVQARLELVFASFLRVRSASQVLRHVHASGLTLPCRDGRHGGTVWRPPSIAGILRTLKNPAYAGCFVYGRSRAVRAGSDFSRPRQKMLPREQWRVVVRDKYPAYVSWETFEKTQAMLRDSYAEYDRNKTRGVPRDGEALLHGLVYCGACGHKMAVQHKNGTRYLCNFLRQQHGTPVCQCIPANPVDAKAAAAFFEALAPAEIDAYAEAMASQREAGDATLRAQAQQVERLRYQAALAERQFDQVDPGNRLVASELERRWEVTLRDLRQAEAALTKGRCETSTGIATLDPDLRAAFSDAGQRLPDLWRCAGMTTARKKALLRCLVGKVVIHRTEPDSIHGRIVWRGGDVSVFDIAVPVGSLAALSQYPEMESRVLELAGAGKDDAAIAAELSAAGYHSPPHSEVRRRTVQAIRLRHGLLHAKQQPHPRRVQGRLTVPQLAAQLGVRPHWIYDRIHIGLISIVRDDTSGLYLFPDAPSTLIGLQKLRAGEIDRLAFGPEAGS